MKNKTSLNSKFWLILVSCTIIHLICYKASSQLRRATTIQSNSSLYKRSNLIEFTITSNSINLNSDHEDEPEPTSLIDYRKFYESSSRSARPFVFTSLAIWLTFLFSFVGITAADFFCPNLSTIASRLGMSESVVSLLIVLFHTFAYSLQNSKSTFIAFNRLVLLS